MISIAEAQQLVGTVASPPLAVHRPLAEVLGLVLAEDVRSDLDMPPHDKALVDGFAVRSADLVQGQVELEVVGKIIAGQPPWECTAALASGQAVQIMTGAAIPPGADAVVMVERTETRQLNSGQSYIATVNDIGFRSGQNIMRRGMEMTRGQIVLASGTQLRPQEVGVLAAIGQHQVPVWPRPHVAVISTGNELVEADQLPGPGQIRNSNGPTLAALVARAGGVPLYRGIARDTTDDLRSLVEEGLEADVLLLSGGVSAGDFDLVPHILHQLAVREVFHKVDLKPGKPVWFGVRDRKPTTGVRDLPRNVASGNLRPDSKASTLVFGLPGNPVSVIVCFELFVRPALRRILGLSDPGPKTVWAALAGDWTTRSDRPTYHPAQLVRTGEKWQVRPVRWKGSGDLRSMVEANAFAIIPPGEHRFRSGDPIQVLCMESHEPSCCSG